MVAHLPMWIPFSTRIVFLLRESVYETRVTRRRRLEVLAAIVIVL